MEAGKASVGCSGCLAALTVAIPVAAIVAFAIGWGAMDMWDGDLGSVIGFVGGILLVALFPPLTLVSSTVGLVLAGVGFAKDQRVLGVLLALAHLGLIGLSLAGLAAMTVPFFT